MTVLALFTRDLRLQDTSLLRDGEAIIPAFIVDTDLAHAHNNPFAQAFMIDSLRDLDKSLQQHHTHLAITHGTFASALTSLILRHKPNTLRMARDITPYAKKREQLAADICAREKITLELVDSHWLLPFDATVKNNSEPYTVFTPFFKHASKLDVPAIATPAKLIFAKLSKSELPNLDAPHIETQRGGRGEAQKILKNLHDYESYEHERDFPSLNRTTHLSAHLHWGTVSVREAHAAIAEQLSPHHPLIRQLWWREFFGSIAYHHPHVWQHNFKRAYDALEWQDNDELLQAWQQGTTGFPIIDAAMRCLNKTGMMHNRLRMIVASFLVKDLSINWREGEKYFAEKLVDYDKVINNGNWQWAAGTGADAAPYFRVFNPWLQQAKFDNGAAFIKKWVPELARIEVKIIHDPTAERPNYPKPIVDHAEAKELALAMFAQALRK
ncbi:MAG: deoxyribodipyrimidine photo-lyase [Patescibacteria group bacterium]|nr:deoxyribodipyrimidine photo-lyase [Patescibacteria group bacterium]